MKKKIVLTLIIISIAILAFTQGRSEARKPDTKMMLQHLSERLDLSQEQQDNIEPYLNEHIKLMEEFRNDTQENEKLDGDKVVQKEFQLKTLKIEQKINEFLTEEQQEEYTKMKEEREQRSGNTMKRKRR